MAPRAKPVKPRPRSARKERRWSIRATPPGVSLLAVILRAFEFGAITLKGQLDPQLSKALPPCGGGFGWGGQNGGIITPTQPSPLEGEGFSFLRPQAYSVVLLVQYISYF